MCLRECLCLYWKSSACCRVIAPKCHHTTPRPLLPSPRSLANFGKVFGVERWKCADDDTRIHIHTWWTKHLQMTLVFGTERNHLCKPMVAEGDRAKGAKGHMAVEKQGGAGCCGPRKYLLELWTRHV